jgi:aspartyl protease family protein
MLKHAVILSAAVVSAVLAGQGVMSLDAMRHARADTATLSGQPDADAQIGPQFGSTTSRVRHHASSAEVLKGPDGHYWAEATVNGRHVRFLVDTGATAVALTLDDARRLSIDPANLRFDHAVDTASGKSRAAVVELDYISVAGARVEHVPALVLESGLQTSLLGMTYLGRLSKFEATQTALILRP